MPIKFGPEYPQPIAGTPDGVTPSAQTVEGKLRVLDLFSGIGGFSLGLERTGGFKTVAFCEIEPFPRRVLAKHWPEVPCFEDIKTADFQSIGPVDMVTGGFPCQDISFAGQGAGLAGERSGLFWHILRTAGLVGFPKLLLENVAGLLSRGMGEVLGAMAQIGYDAEWHCIPASAVGAPHRRDRIWIVADARGQQHQSNRAPLGGQIAAQLSGADMADTTIIGQSGPGQSIVTGDCEAEGKGQAAYAFAGRIGQVWAVEPDVGRVAHGVPDRAHRLAGLGNAVVPQIPELIGRAILSAEQYPPA